MLSLIFVYWVLLVAKVAMTSKIPRALCATKDKKKSVQCYERSVYNLW